MTLPGEFLREISKEALAALPIQRYEGKVVLVESPAQADSLRNNLLSEDVLGFDTETRPAFRPGESYLPSLVQLAAADAVYLFQVQRHDFSALLGEILSNGKTKAGVSVADDLKNLKKLFEFHDANVVDLGKVAKSHGMKQSGVRNLTGLLLGTRIPKGAKTTNWAAPRLTQQQVTYAATDAWACRVLYLRFRELGLL
jgi:ribonuclease D